MDGQRGFWYARCQKVLSTAIFSISLAACGSITPTGLAWVGKPDALIQEVLAGRIDPNGDYLTETNRPNKGRRSEEAFIECRSSRRRLKEFAFKFDANLF